MIPADRKHSSDTMWYGSIHPLAFPLCIGGVTQLMQKSQPDYIVLHDLLCGFTGIHNISIFPLGINHDAGRYNLFAGIGHACVRGCSMVWNCTSIDSINQYYHGNIVRAHFPCGSWRGKAIMQEAYEREHLNCTKWAARIKTCLFPQHLMFPAFKCCIPYVGLITIKRLNVLSVYKQPLRTSNAERATHWGWPFVNDLHNLNNLIG